MVGGVLPADDELLPVPDEELVPLELLPALDEESVPLELLSVSDEEFVSLELLSVPDEELVPLELLWSIPLDGDELPEEGKDDSS